MGDIMIFSRLFHLYRKKNEKKKRKKRKKKETKNEKGRISNLIIGEIAVQKLTFI